MEKGVTQQEIIQVRQAIELVESGLAYRNPAPHLRSLHAYYPSVVSLCGGKLLMSFVLGSAIEAMDCQVYLTRSDDEGKTWQPPVPLHEKSLRHTETCRISRMHDGEIVLLLSESERLEPNVGATNPANLGHVPTRLSLFRSVDDGASWQGPEPLEPPLIGPTFELCTPIVQLTDGRWLLPTSTWRDWNGFQPNGMKAVAFVSDDRGRTWQSSIDVMNGVAQGILYWEQKICEMGGGRCLAVAWTHVEETRTDLPNSFALASTDALKFSTPESTGLIGQTPALLHLGGNAVLCIYRRMDHPGLSACLVEIDDNGAWHTKHEQLLWQPAQLATRRSGQHLVEEFRGLKFGAPSLVRLADNEILVAFWCVEDCVANIRWIRLHWQW